MLDGDGLEWDPNDGWNRASVGFWSRKRYKPNVSPDDLLMPNGLGNLRMLGSCVAMAGMMTALYVWPPVFLIGFWLPVRGVLYGEVLGGALVAFTLVLYLAGARETRRDRELAARL